MIAADLHSHTIASHGLDNASAMLQAAIEKGLDYFGISEHSPLPCGLSCALYTENLEESLPRLLQELNTLKNKKTSLRLLAGLELDWTPCNRQWMHNLVHSYNYDYILGSLHFLDGKSTGNILSWAASQTRSERYERFTAYFYEMASMCSSGLIDIVAHPDFIKLRVWKDFQTWLKTEEATKAIEHTLAAMAKFEIAMEVNSAGLRQPFREFYPCPAIMKLAKKFGVKLAFGSDAHTHADIKADFASAENYARECGFDCYQIFIGRKPVSMPF